MSKQILDISLKVIELSFKWIDSIGLVVVFSYPQISLEKYLKSTKKEKLHDE